MKDKRKQIMTPKGKDEAPTIPAKKTLLSVGFQFFCTCIEMYVQLAKNKKKKKNPKAAKKQNFGKISKIAKCLPFNQISLF